MQGDECLIAPDKIDSMFEFYDPNGRAYTEICVGRIRFDANKPMKDVVAALADAGLIEVIRTALDPELENESK